ncbi:MAG: sigma-70 family RNA polymerase sigma factor [Ilumatobacteraceae bacterium]
MDARSFEQITIAERPRLLGLAYRLVGSYSDAEDLVQDALGRFQRAATSDIGSPAAYLTTVTTRLAIDHLRSARVRRETYVGPWLPEPIAADPAPDALTQAILNDTLSIAFLLMLEKLSPDERAALVLHDVFAYSHSEIAEVLERSEPACRQLLRRARRRLDDDRRRSDVDPLHRDLVVDRFIAACSGGDFDSFLVTLRDDVELVFDGGPTIKTAARHPITGAERVARFLAFAMARMTSTRRIERTTLNGGPAALIYSDFDHLVGAVFVEPAHDDARALNIRWVRNPAKLRALA